MLRTTNAELQKRRCILTVKLQNLGSIQNVILPRVHLEFQTSETRVHTLKVKSQKPGCTLHLIKYDIFFLFLSHFSGLLQSMHNHRLPHEAPAEMHIDIKSCNTPNFYDTYHTFMTLYLYFFDNMFLQEACSRRSKHLLKLIPFLCFCLMTGQNCCAALWQNQQNDLCGQRRLRSAWASAQSDQSSLSA